MSYRSDYITDLFVNVYNETADKTMEFKLFGAWPQTISETRMAWDDTNNRVELNVTFQFTDWRLISTTQSNTLGQLAGRLTGDSRLAKVESIINNVNSAYSVRKMLSNF